MPAALGRQSDGDNGPKVATGVAGTVCGVYKVSTGLLIRIGKPEGKQKFRVVTNRKKAGKKIHVYLTHLRERRRTVGGVEFYILRELPVK